MRENTNKNCLEGMRCPNCGDLGPFQVEAKAMITVHDDGTEDDVTDYDWSGDSVCICCECNHVGTVDTFTEDNQEPMERLLTELAAARAEVEKKDKQIARLNRMLEQFVGNVRW